MKRDMNTIALHIGTLEREYLAYETSAPKAYDGFGTLEMDVETDKRYVLIDRKHLDWQLNRYSSGLHGATPSNEMVRRLWERRASGTHSRSASGTHSRSGGRVMTDFKQRNDGERLDIPGYAMKPDEDRIAHERRRIGRIARITFANMPLKRSPVQQGGGHRTACERGREGTDA